MCERTKPLTKEEKQQMTAGVKTELKVYVGADLKLLVRPLDGGLEIVMGPTEPDPLQTWSFGNMRITIKDTSVLPSTANG